MHDFTPWASSIGGVLIGLAASVLHLFTGRTAGVSGIFGGLVWGQRSDRGWRLQFVAGLLAGGVLLLVLRPVAFGVSARSWPQLAAAGVLVGFGAQVSGGCTSGHGICGLGRLSVRSLVAVVTFMAAGIVTVLVVGRILGSAA